MRSFVRWQESDKARWTVLERSNSRIVVEGSMWALPLSQRWIVELTDRGFRWSVAARARANLRLARQQVSLMLSERYDELSGSEEPWMAIGPFRRAVTDDWDVLYSPPPEDHSIALRASDGSLPAVRLRSEDTEIEGELVVVNSDLDFRARLLQFRQVRERDLAPDEETTLFRGEVVIGA
jgi:hypothetical protein